MEVGQGVLRYVLRQRHDLYRSRGNRTVARARSLRDFAFSSFSNADGAAALERAKEEARQKEKRDLKLRICGFDVSPDAVSLARFHLKAAGLEGAVHFQVGDMRDFSSRFAHGVAVTNPPYGERLCDRKELKNLYRDFGNMFGRLDEWSLLC